MAVGVSKKWVLPSSTTCSLAGLLSAVVGVFLIFIYCIVCEGRSQEKAWPLSQCTKFLQGHMLLLGGREGKGVYFLALCAFHHNAVGVWQPI